MLPACDLDDIVANADSSWDELRGCRLFITGGTGYVGRWLLASMCNANQRRRLGLKAVVLTRNPDEFGRRAPELADNPAIDLWHGDVRDFAFPIGEFSHVIHGATDTSLAAAERPFDLSDTILAGTRRVLEFARHSGSKRLLYLSSGAVYGQAAEIEHISEGYAGGCDPLDRRSTYGESKRMAEHYCLLNALDVGLECVIARGFAFVGPLLALDGHFAIGNFIRDALDGKAIHVQGDGSAVRSYLYAADMAAWLWSLLTAGRSCEAYNVGSDQAISIVDLARTVAHTLAPDKPVMVAGACDSSGHRNHYVPNINKARNELGLEVWTPLDEAIRRTAQYEVMRREAVA